jgi:aminopeptidase N
MTSVEGADIIGGGMEFPMLTLIGSYEGGGPQDLFNVTSHELAHMWIPMIVGSNEKRHAWMDEGSTTFLEDQSRMELWPGVDHHRLEAQQYSSAAAAVAEQSMMRHGDYYEPGPGYGIASYSKPATLMAALRVVMGREVWEEAYRTFVQEWAYKHPTPWDFFNTFERFAGRDLDWFWTSFYFETWTVDFDAVSVRPRTEGGATVNVVNRGFAPFPVTVRIYTTGEGVLEREVDVGYWLDGNRAIDLDVPPSAGSVTRVEVDPLGYVPDVDRTNNFWPRG